ncbi:MAG: magnesium/cobalt transporter CorA [Kiritimatiellae bacterium]|nr:magnesium/cobalt transporter CorA [Kiritimatiellia bacterium]
MSRQKKDRPPPPVLMPEERFHHRAPPGAAPGTLVVDPRAPKPAITVIAYGPDGFTEDHPQDIDALRALLNRRPVTWINVDGLGDADTLKALGELFHIHPLALEDVINVHQRAKVEPYRDNQFIVARMVEFREDVLTEQISLFLGPDYVVTFQEKAGDCFDPVRERIRKSGHRIRSAGADFLCYALLDAVVDACYPILERFGDRLDALQEEVLSKPARATVTLVHNAKRDLRTLRRAIWPLREMFNALYRDSLPMIAPDTRLYFRDCYDHTIQIIDLVETYRETASDLTDVYLSSVSHRMNEVMKVLTIIATIFIPLTFIAGIYGMNFNPESSPWNMPELNWKLGYPFALGLMALTVLVMLAFFRRKGWLGADR